MLPRRLRKGPAASRKQRRRFLIRVYLIYSSINTLDTQGFVPTSTIVTVPAREIKSQNQDGACRHWRARAPRLDGFCRWDWPTRAGRDLAPRRASTGCVALAASLRYAQPVVAASVLTRSLGEPLSETWAVQASASRTARSRGPCARQTLSFPPSATTTVACRTA